MKTFLEKPASRSRSAAASVSPKNAPRSPARSFADNRREAVAQRKLAALSDIQAARREPVGKVVQLVRPISHEVSLQLYNLKSLIDGGARAANPVAYQGIDAWTVLGLSQEKCQELSKLSPVEDKFIVWYDNFKQSQRWTEVASRLGNQLRS